MYIKAWINVNTDCNLKCNRCYNRFNEMSEISLERLKTLATILKEANILKIILLGGEPTLHTNIIEIINILMEKELDVTLVTNGLRFNSNKSIKQQKNQI